VQDTVTAGSPVFVETTVTNKSEDFYMWVENDVDQAGSRFQANVRDAEGKVPPETKFGFYHDRPIDVGRVIGTTGVDWRYLDRSGVCFTFKAGASLTDKVDVSRLYNLDAPGTYTIVLSLTALPAVKSNPVTVTVVPAPAPPSAPATGQAPASAPFSLDIGRSYTVRAGLGADVLVVTKNVSAHSIVLRRQAHERDTGMLGSLFRVDVQDSQGNPPPDAELGQSANHLAEAPPDPASMALARAAGTVVSLRPGQDWRNTIRVSDLYDLSKPGQYTIQVRRWDDETKTWVRSNTITATVEP
jgi:hypothetical protein